jgi:putative PIN family toxin of toxin-antitoxin system
MTRDRIVFDCNVYFQALIGPNGPAGACLEAAEKSSFDLYASEYVLNELNNVCMRPGLAAKFGFTPARVTDFLRSIRRFAILLDNIPHVFTYPRDPDDEHYVDLAAACNAHLIASRDRDLLALNDVSTETGKQFRLQFPDLLIMTPDQLLARIHDVSE